MSSINTVIWVRKETQDRLKGLGKKGDTYDEIISRLLELHEKVGAEPLRLRSSPTFSVDSLSPSGGGQP